MSPTLWNLFWVCPQLIFPFFVSTLSHGRRLLRGIPTITDVYLLSYSIKCECLRAGLLPCLSLYVQHRAWYWGMLSKCTYWMDFSNEVREVRSHSWWGQSQTPCWWRPQLGFPVSHDSPSHVTLQFPILRMRSSTSGKISSLNSMRVIPGSSSSLIL